MHRFVFGEVLIDIVTGAMLFSQFLHDFVSDDETCDAADGKWSLRNDFEVLIEAIVDMGLVRDKIIDEFTK